jgi:acetyl esterase
MAESSLDVQAQKILEAGVAAGLPPVYTLPPAEARERMRAAFISDAPYETVSSVENVVIPAPVGGIPVRIYRPHSGVLPVIMFFHGGGWVLNDLDTHERVCRRLANATQAAVVSVDYRRAPEAPYPTPIDDCFMATEWVSRQGDKLGFDIDRLCVAGDSSGGTCAAVVSMLARDRGFPNSIRCQVLMYPVTTAPDRGSGSYLTRGIGYSLNADFMDWFWSHYTSGGNAETSDPYLCPLEASSLAGLPPAVVVTAEFDPLCDEGRRYAEKLRADGVKVQHIHAEDQMHGFIMQTAIIDYARELLDVIAEAIVGELRAHVGEATVAVMPS